MITNVGLLLEELSILFCIHCLYDKKFKLDILTTGYLTIYMIIITAINYYNLSSVFSFSTYLIIALYCGLRFGFKWRELLINSILYLLIIGVIQLIVAISCGYIFKMLSFNVISIMENEMFIINVGVFLIVIVFLPKLRINRLSTYLLDKERILLVSLLFCVILLIFSLVNYKIVDGFKGYQYLILFVSIILLCTLAGQLGKYKLKSKEIETELKMNKLYSDSFYSLIEDIRSRQHEFDNHISAIYGLHYTCNSLEELVEAQNEYSQEVIKENRYNKLLKAGNPLLIGFLYGKFIEIEKHSIVVDYAISIHDLNVGIPVYKIVEILGNLMKNATEALKDTENNRELFVSVIEKNNVFEIEVRNKSKFIDYSQIDVFFKKGFSQKGKDRGLGLYNVKNICNEYLLDILCENKLINGENWLSFTISNKKETI